MKSPWIGGGKILATAFTGSLTRESPKRSFRGVVRSYISTLSGGEFVTLAVHFAFLVPSIGAHHGLYEKKDQVSWVDLQMYEASRPAKFSHSMSYRTKAFSALGCTRLRRDNAPHSDGSPLPSESSLLAAERRPAAWVSALAFPSVLAGVFLAARAL